MRHLPQLDAEQPEQRAQLGGALAVAADRRAERREPGPELHERAALERAGAGDRAEDRHPGPRRAPAWRRLLAAAHAHRHPPDHRPPGTDSEGSRVYIALTKPSPSGSAWSTTSTPVGLERGDEPGVLLGHLVEVGRRAVRPVPAAAGVHERAELLVPRVGAHRFERAPGARTSTRRSRPTSSTEPQRSPHTSSSSCSNGGSAAAAIRGWCSSAVMARGAAPDLEHLAHGRRAPRDAGVQRPHDELEAAGLELLELGHERVEAAALLVHEHDVAGADALRGRAPRLRAGSGARRRTSIRWSAVGHRPANARPPPGRSARPPPTPRGAARRSPRGRCAPRRSWCARRPARGRARRRSRRGPRARS